MMQSRSDRGDYSYREQAIPLVSVDPKTNSTKQSFFLIIWIEFVINNEAIDFLNSIKGNIGVISVAGMYRTGKSYLLNRVLLDRSSGFGVGPSINPCTKVTYSIDNILKSIGYLAVDCTFNWANSRRRPNHCFDFGLWRYRSFGWRLNSW